MKLRIFGFAVAALLLAMAPAAIGIPDSYGRSIENVLKSEGGERYTNHPNDPGGPTKYGITIHDVRLYIDRNATAQTVKDLTKAQALSIYRGKYWEHACVRADDLPAGLDYSLFDYGVNAGVSRAGKVLRRTLGLDASQCAVTAGVIRALGRKDAEIMVRAVNAERRRFYGNLIEARPAMAVFRRGWLNRVDTVERISLRMAGAPPEFGLFGEEILTEPAFGPGKAWLR